MSKSKCIAFIIGIDDYDNFNKLNSAVKDAVDFTQTLTNLKFEVELITDCTFSEAYTAFYNFLDKLPDKYDAAVFYFAGHGKMINRTDCLMMKDAPQSDRTDDIKPRAYCLSVEEIIQKLNAAGDQTNIVIIDACRVSSDVRGRTGLMDFGQNIGKIPYQTLVAFSTAPGTPAKDGKVGKNSPFTTSLLAHIMEENLDVELLFKRVRKDIKERGYEQYPWEHTCLIEQFCFNHGQLNKYYDLPYEKEAFVRANYVLDQENDNINIIKPFISADAHLQTDNVSAFVNVRERLSPTQLFIIGRGIYALAANGEAIARHFLLNSLTVSRFQSISGNHLLRGIYYEIFFDENDNLRDRPMGNTGLLSDIERLRIRLGDKDSEKFVLNLLPEDYGKRGYCLGKTPDFKFKLKLGESELYDDTYRHIMYVEEISLNNRSLMPFLKRNRDNLLMDWNELRWTIGNSYALPLQKTIMLPSISKSKEWEKLVLIDDLPDIEELLRDFFVNEIPEEVDCLATLAYVEEVDGAYPTQIFQEADKEIRIRGNMTVTVHLEYDGEDSGNMSFPGSFFLKVTFSESDNKWIADRDNCKVKINTEKFYK